MMQNAKNYLYTNIYLGRISVNFSHSKKFYHEKNHQKLILINNHELVYRKMMAFSLKLQLIHEFDVDIIDQCYCVLLISKL